jgi:hypothetical protein
MIRWWFVVALVLGAVLSQFTPAAFADGCEGGDATAGHNAIAFCCGGGNGGGKGGQNGQARIISGNHSGLHTR